VSEAISEPTSPTDELELERHGRVLVVTLDRETRMNALSHAVREGLLETWSSLKRDSRVRLRAIASERVNAHANCCRSSDEVVR
jgi:enoyl-CoA hydratase/carnithine racemase